MGQMTAKLADVVYFLMKTKREDELIALINFVSRRDMRDINKIRRNTTPDLDNDNGGEKAVEWWDGLRWCPIGPRLLQSGTDLEDWDAPRGDVQDDGTMAAWGEPTVFEAMQSPGQLSCGAGLGGGGDEASWLTALGYQTWLEEMQVAEARAWGLRYYTAEEIAGRTGYECDDDGGSSTGGSSSSGAAAEPTWDELWADVGRSGPGDCGMAEVWADRWRSWGCEGTV